MVPERFEKLWLAMEKLEIYMYKYKIFTLSCLYNITKKCVLYFVFLKYKILKSKSQYMFTLIVFHYKK